ncbi:MAG: serine protease [Treponema sp.]|nr:serine protease [Treponema sp.]
MKKIVFSRIKLVSLWILFNTFSIFPLFAEKNSSDWISADTVSAVVKLSSLLNVYTVDGLDESYVYSEKGGNPDFGDAKIISCESQLVHVGTGVVVTPTGMILSNAHVTEAYSNVQFYTKYNPYGNEMIGMNGKPLKQVIVPVYPRHMFVGVCSKDDVEQNKDKQKLSYVAEVILSDNDYNSGIRDRAILQIIRSAYLSDENNLPVVVENSNVFPQNMNYVDLGNPFDISYLDNKVRAVGFPGDGDPNRSSKTSGELLGYSSDESSDILHTSWISNGNSGGGLFYNNKLIGINTWDNRSNVSRPVAIAQPVTYWDHLFSYTKWINPEIHLPCFSYDWVDADPSSDPYKNDAYVALSVVRKNNSRSPVTEGSILTYRGDLSISDVAVYQEYEAYFNEIWNLVTLLWTYSQEEVMEAYGINEESASILKYVTSRSELKNILEEADTPYFDWWVKDSFVYNIFGIANNGKSVVKLPKNTKVNIAYVDVDGNAAQSQTLKISDKFEQGPYTVKVGQ